MANRNTKTEKWRDGFFSKLSPESKLLFIYLCENCDIAGFIEYVPKIWNFDTGLNIKQIAKSIQDIDKAIYFSKDKTIIFLKNFIKHQNNLPLNSKNNAHKSILVKLEYFKHSFDFQLINEIILGGSEGLISPPVMSCNVMSCNSNVDEEKKDKKFIPPLIDEMIEFFKKNGYSQKHAEKVFNYYSSANWIDSKGYKVKNWKQKCISVWFKEDGKIINQNKELPPHILKGSIFSGTMNKDGSINP